MVRKKIQGHKNNNLKEEDRVHMACNRKRNTFLRLQSMQRREKDKGGYEKCGNEIVNRKYIHYHSE